MTFTLPTTTVTAFVRRHMLEIILATVGIMFAFAFILPGSVLANTLTQTEAEREAISLQVDAMINVDRPFGELPEAEYGNPRWSMVMPISAYTSRPQETDDTPFIMASGNLVYDGAVATNYLPLGTRIRIPALYGDKVFVVEDRMNKRYHKRMDIWMEDLGDARQHGVKYLEVEVF